MNHNKSKSQRDIKDEVFSLWLFGEMAFTILPIAIVAIVNLAYGKSVWDIFFLPDWSFSSVILFGIAINQLIEIKTKYQKDFSYKIFIGTRLLVLLIILSAVILMLSVARQQGAQIDPFFVVGFQMIVFVIAAGAVYISIDAKQKFLDTAQRSDSVSAVEVGAYLSHSLHEAEEFLRMCAKTCSQNKNLLNEQSEIDKEDIVHLLKKIEVNINKIRETIQQQ